MGQLKKEQLPCFRQVCRMPNDKLTQRIFETQVPGRNKRERHRRILENIIREEMQKKRFEMGRNQTSGPRYEDMKRKI